MLGTKGRSRSEINILANICFLTRADNNTLKDSAPAIYSDEIDSRRKDDYLTRAFIPSDFGSIEYDVFIEKRTALLKEKAKELMA